MSLNKDLFSVVKVLNLYLVTVIVIVQNLFEF